MVVFSNRPPRPRGGGVGGAARRCALAALPPGLRWCPWSAPGRPSGARGRAGGVASRPLALCFPVWSDWALLAGLTRAPAWRLVVVSPRGWLGWGVEAVKLCRWWGRRATVPRWPAPSACPHAASIVPRRCGRVSDSGGCRCVGGVPSGWPGSLKDKAPEPCRRFPLLLVGGESRPSVLAGGGRWPSCRDGGTAGPPAGSAHTDLAADARASRCDPYRRPPEFRVVPFPPVGGSPSGIARLGVSGATPPRRRKPSLAIREGAFGRCCRWGCRSSPPPLGPPPLLPPLCAHHR